MANRLCLGERSAFMKGSISIPMEDYLANSTVIMSLMGIAITISSF